VALLHHLIEDEVGQHAGVNAQHGLDLSFLQVGPQVSDPSPSQFEEQLSILFIIDRVALDQPRTT